MANEKRLDLIDRQELIKAAQKKLFGIGDNTHPYKAVEIVGKYFREVVDNAPTVDAVEVVRCKDCVHGFWDEENEMWKCVESAEYDSNFGDYIGFVEYHNEDFFCSYGERKDNGKSTGIE